MGKFCLMAAKRNLETQFSIFYISCHIMDKGVDHKWIIIKEELKEFISY